LGLLTTDEIPDSRSRPSVGGLIGKVRKKALNLSWEMKTPHQNSIPAGVGHGVRLWRARNSLWSQKKVMKRKDLRKGDDTEETQQWKRES